MKTIELTQGQVAIVDDTDWAELSVHKWCAHWYVRGHAFYAAHGALIVNGKKTPTQMHRIIMGAQKGQQVDHINHNTLDNRRENLRLCTHTENQHNQKPRTGGSSIYKGVCLYKDSNKWGARIQINGQSHWLGVFSDEHVAALAYDAAARKLHGDYAYLNF